MTGLLIQIGADDINHIMLHTFVNQIEADLGGKLLFGVFKRIECLLHIARSAAAARRR